MSNQVQHALIQAAIMVGIAALGSLIESQTSILQSFGVDPIFWPIAGAVLAAAYRWFEGLRDSERAVKGIVVPADVGYTYLREQAADPFNYNVTPLSNSNAVRVLSPVK